MRVFMTLLVVFAILAGLVSLVLSLVFVGIGIFKKGFGMKKAWISLGIGILLSGVGLVSISLIPENNADAKTEAKTKVKNDSRKKDMLKTLNQWASKNNNYGKVKINNKNEPELYLNKETSNLSHDKLNSIVKQYSNKVSAQKEMTKAKVDNPIVSDSNNTVIAVWNGSALELSDK